MSRANYDDDYDGPITYEMWQHNRDQAFAGKRGQKLLRDILAGMDALPEKVLIVGALKDLEGDFCALGCGLKQRGVEMEPTDPEDDEFDNRETAEWLGVASCMTFDIAHENDDGGHWGETPQQRFTRMRTWIARQINPTPPPPRP